MLASSLIQRSTAVIIILLGGCDLSGRAQTTFSGEQTSLLVELLKNIKGAVQSGRYENLTDVYKTVSIRLAQCSIIYGILAQREGTKQSAHAAYSSIYFRAASALYPENYESFKRALEQSKEDLVKLRQDEDKKAQIQHLRNCADFSEPNSVGYSRNL